MEKQYCDNTCALIGIWKASSVEYWDRDEHGVSDHWITVFDDDTTFDTVVFDVDGTYTPRNRLKMVQASAEFAEIGRQRTAA